MDIVLKNDKLIITVDVSKEAIEKAKPSSTGKSKIIATSSGYMPVNGSGIKVSLNVITK